MARQDSKAKKLAVLELVKEEKDVLFAKFSSSTTSKTKEAAWNRVLEKAKSLGLVDSKRNHVFFRDKVFGVWKSRALAKRDNSRRTGTGGGKVVLPDEVDVAIYDILGNSSPTVTGLSLPESGGVEGPETGGVEGPESSSSWQPAPPPPTPSASGPPYLSLPLGYDEDEEELFDHPLLKKKKKKKKTLRTRSDLELDEREKKLRIDFLELGIYKKKLECLQLERNLLLPPSK